MKGTRPALVNGPAINEIMEPMATTHPTTTDDLVSEFRTQLTAAQERIRSLERELVTLRSLRDVARGSTLDLRSLVALLGRPRELHARLLELMGEAP